MERAIVHLNVADFAVAVERSLNPCLKGSPLIVAPRGSGRALVFDMSEEAYQEGVRKGMPLNRAMRRSRQAKILPPSLNRYERAMAALFKKAMAFSPLIESGVGDGHLFLDATGTSRLFGPAVDVAWRLSREIKKSASFDPVWSVAPNKLVAKVATRLAKPTGEYIVGPGEESAFLAPLPLSLIPGLERSDLVKLKELNLFCVSQARCLALDQLEVLFGIRAPFIHGLIHGLDSTAVSRACDNGRALQANHEFAEDTNDELLLKRGLYILVAALCRQLRLKKRQACRVKLLLSYSDGVQKSSTVKLRPETANPLQLFKPCNALFRKIWARRVRIRHMGLICVKTTGPQIQLALFDRGRKLKRQARLMTAMDRIHGRFGNRAVQSGLTLLTEGRGRRP